MSDRQPYRDGTKSVFRAVSELFIAGGCMMARGGAGLEKKAGICTPLAYIDGLHSCLLVRNGRFRCV